MADPQDDAGKIQPALGALEVWCGSNHLAVAPEKTEALLITVDPKQNNGKCRPPLVLCDTPVTYKTSIRILGVTLDTQLTMAEQARTAADRINSRTRALATVAARTWGADTGPLRQLYQAYVRPSGTYASGAWFPYLSGTHVARLEAANYRAARVITGAPSRSNTAAVVREAGLMPISTVARLDAARQLLHYRRFGEGHHLRKLAGPPEVATRIRRQGGSRGCWREAALSTLEAGGMRDLVPEPIAPQRALLQPWEWSTSVEFSATPAAARTISPEARRTAAEEHLEELRRSVLPDMELWTDGVRQGGAGFTVRWTALLRGQHRDTTVSLPTGMRTDSTASESAALAAGLRHLAAALHGTRGRVVWALFDSRALHDRLQNPSLCREDQATIRAASSLRDLGRHHRVHVIWVPGHAGLPGNEAADAAARAGCDMPQDNTTTTAAAARAQLKEAIRGEWRRSYETAVGADHIHRTTTGGESLPDYPGRSRRGDVLLHQLRVGRGPFLQETRHRWGLSNSPECPHCLQLRDGVDSPPEDAAHFFIQCPRWAALRAEVLGPSPSLHDVLHINPSRALEFVQRAGVSPLYAERQGL